MNRKGIILSAGEGTRLYPITKFISKQLLPVYNKPLIFYPLSTLILSGIRDVLIITKPNESHFYKKLLGNGQNLGIKIKYEIQKKSNGIAESILIASKFIGEDSFCLILGDNIFYANNLAGLLQKANFNISKSTLISTNMKNPEKYGVIKYDKKKVLKIIEKPKKFISNDIITGLYFYENIAVKIAKQLKPSKRGELEITDLNNELIKLKRINVLKLGRGFSWFDTGSFVDLFNASNFVKLLEENQNLKVGVPEESAYSMGFIDKKQIKKKIKENSTYYNYLKSII